MKSPDTVVKPRVSINVSCATSQPLSNENVESLEVRRSLMEASTNTTQSLMKPVSEQDLLVASEVRKTNPKRSGKENIQPVTSVEIGGIYFHKLAGHPSWPVRVTEVSKAG